MSIKHILFDLDGTLLPMVQDEFVKCYMPMLAQSYIEGGIPINPKEFLAAVWKGYEAMVQNDGSCTNKEVFWKYMNRILQAPEERVEELTIQFYTGEFNKAIVSTQPTPLADQVVKKAKEKGLKVYLATNPVFPRPATMSRMKWAGLDAADFEVITTYENYSYCKPNVAYFRTIVEQFGLNPEECLMVGNDVEEDLVIRQLGIKTFLLTDTMENKKNLPIETEYRGSMEELLAFVNGLDLVEERR